MNEKIYIKSGDSNSKTNFFLNRLNTIILCAVFCITVLTLLIGCGQKEEKELVLGELTIDAGDYDRINTPIRYQCLTTDIFGDPAKFQRPGFFHYIDDGADLSLLRDHHLVLFEEGRAESKINVQWAPEIDFDWERVAGKGALFWILDGETKKGTKRTFNLVLEEGKAPSGPFTVDDIDNKQLLVKKGEREVLRYNYGVIQQNKEKSGEYDRASYIHPVWTPTGKVITGDFSPEHIHQRGIFFAWRRVNFSDVEADFWSLGKEAGRKLPDDLGPSIEIGPVFAGLGIFNKGNVNGRTYMKETCAIRVYALPEEDIWLFDIYLRQMPVNPKRPQIIPTEVTTATVIVDGKVKRIQTEKVESGIYMEIEKELYGGMAYRGIGEWLSEDVSLDVLTSEGKTRLDANETQAQWIDYTGPLGDEWGGVVIFDHPINQRYPTPLRVHPQLPYFCYAFTQNEPYTVYDNAPLSLVYRFLIHTGHPNKEINERFANDYVNPPEVSWQPLE